MAGPIPAGFGRGRAREWVEEGKGEAREVRARRIRAGWQGTAGGASDGARLVLCSRELEEWDEGKGREDRRSFQGVREDKGGARRARFAGMLNAWRSSPACRRRHGRRASTVMPHGRTVNGLTNF